MKTILFQGDSITDAGRARDLDHDMGKGYPNLVMAQLGYDNPEKYTFINKGIGGNRVVDLYARIKCDIINLKPDVMSILVGVNDVWHEIRNGNGVHADKYMKVYSMLIEEVKAELPDVKIMILEPFVLEGTATLDQWQQFRSEVELRAEKAKEVSEKYGLTFIPLQSKFDEAAKNTSPDYWLRDGVHPTPMGHELIKREWIKTFDLSIPG